MKYLLIEDERKIAGFIKRGLEEGNCQVVIVGDGAEGLRLAQTGEYALVILDLGIPEIDGFSVLKELRSTGNQVPVLILTARKLPEEVVAGLEAGSDDYMGKPFAFRELRARIAALLRRAGRNRGSEVVFGELKLDPVTHRFWRSGNEISLSEKEYCLMEYMIRNPNQILTRSMIASNCWVNTFEGKFSNIIDVYVTYLRRKVDVGYPTKMIHTVRGKGYILREY